MVLIAPVVVVMEFVAMVVWCWWNGDSGVVLVEW